MPVIIKLIGLISSIVGIVGIFTGSGALVLWGAVIAIIFGGFMVYYRNDGRAAFVMSFFLSAVINGICCAIGMLFSHFVLSLGWADAFLYSSCWIMAVTSLIGAFFTLVLWPYDEV